MNFTIKQIAIAAIAIFLLGAGAGRFLTPEKVKIETKTVTVEVEKKQEKQKVDTNTDRDRHRETTVTEVVKPDGTRETTTHSVDDTKTDRHTDNVTNTTTQDQKSQTAETSKEVTRGSAPVTVVAMAGLQLSLSSPIVYGGAITKPIFGPVTVGAFGLSNGTFGVSAGLTF